MKVGLIAVFGAILALVSAGPEQCGPQRPNDARSQIKRLMQQATANTLRTLQESSNGRGSCTPTTVQRRQEW